MAKITPSALITEIKGRWGGDSFQMWKGTITAKSSPKGYRQRTSGQQNIRGHISDLSTRHYLLCSEQKTAWDSLAGSHYPGKSGFNVFCSLNLNIRLSNISGLTTIPNPPPTYNKPYTPVITHARYSCITQKAYFSFAAPVSATTFVFTQFSPQVYYNNRRSANWITRSCFRSNRNIIPVDLSKYPDKYTFLFRGKSMTCYGVSSGYSSSNSTVKNENFNYSPFIFISNNDKVYLSEFSTISKGHVRTISFPINGYNYSVNISGITSDDRYIYISNSKQDHIIVLYKATLDYFTHFGSTGSGSLNFDSPMGITCDCNFLYICDQFNDRIVRYTKDDFSLSGIINSVGFSVYSSSSPSIYLYNNYLYVIVRNSYMVKRYYNFNSSISDNIVPRGDLSDESGEVTGIFCKNDKLFVASADPRRVLVYSTNTLNHLENFGEDGVDDPDVGSIGGICGNDSNIFTSDIYENVIKVWALSDYSFLTDFSGIAGTDGNIINPYTLNIIPKYYGNN